MCQLLGMNCNTPTDIGFSFAGFRRRGGMTDSHEDGFGIAFLSVVSALIVTNQRMLQLVYAYSMTIAQAIYRPWLIWLIIIRLKR